MPLTLYRALVIIYLLALSSESILLSLPCAEQGVSGQRPWPPHLMRLLAYLQSYGFSALALVVNVWKQFGVH